MGLRKWAIAALVVLVALGIADPAYAWLASKVGVSVGDFFFGNENVVQKPSATLFHRQTAATTDAEAFALSFPFTGPDSLVLPEIAQTSAGSATATDTGFFTANWCYTALSNLGGYDLVPDVGLWHPIKSPLPIGAGVSWPYMNNAPLYGESTLAFSPTINMAPDTSAVSFSQSPGIPGDASGTPASTKMSFSNGTGNMTIPGTRLVNQSTANAGNRTTGNATAGNATSAANKSKMTPNRDYKNMTKADIQNMTGLERVYRNANMKNTLPQSYKGTVDRPTVIAPLDKPMDLIKPADKPKVIADSRNMTQQGKHLKTLFWDL